MNSELLSLATVSTEPERLLREELKQAKAEVRRYRRRSRQIRAELKNVVRDYLLLKMPKGGSCAEIGVDEGDFS